MKLYFKNLFHLRDSVSAGIQVKLHLEGEDGFDGLERGHGRNGEVLSVLFNNDVGLCRRQSCPLDKSDP